MTNDCLNCYYSSPKHRKAIHRMVCNYILVELHRRPCPATDCKRLGVWKPAPEAKGPAAYTVKKEKNGNTELLEVLDEYDPATDEMLLRLAKEHGEDVT